MSLIEPTSEPVFSGPLPVEPAAAAPVEAETPPESVPEAEPEVFDRKYVEDLRKEAADWRTKYQEYNKAFEGYSPEDRDQYLKFARLNFQAQQGDEDAIRELDELLGNTSADEPTPAQSVEEPPALTPEMVKQMAEDAAKAIVEAREKDRLAQEAVQNIQSQAKDLGYHPDPEHPDFWEYQRVTFIANRLAQSPTPPDDLIKAAHEQHQAEMRAKLDAYLEERARTADGMPGVASGGGASPSLATPPKSWEEARESLRERYANMRR